MVSRSLREKSPTVVQVKDLWNSDELKSKAAICANSSQLLRLFFEWKKKQEPKISIGAVCKRAKIPSRGYLSDVMAGKRNLNQKYAAGIAQALGLKGFARKLWFNMMDLDTQIQLHADVQTQREKILKSWSVNRSPMPSGGDDHYFVMEVFTSFGLFGGAASRAQLIEFFGARDRVISALRTLVTWGLVEEIADLQYQVRNGQVVFSGSADGFSHHKYLRNAIEVIRNSSQEWFRRPDVALTQAVTISAKASEVPRFIAKVRDQIDLLKAELECDDADSMIAFNLFSFPLRGKILQENQSKQRDEA
jgi:uncharacterized protein (TIGR02147 family)